MTSEPLSPPAYGRPDEDEIRARAAGWLASFGPPPRRVPAEGRKTSFPLACDVGAASDYGSPDERLPALGERRQTRYPGPASRPIPACRCAHAGYVLAHFVHATHAVALPGTLPQ